mgnify:CR=1 FL=1
MYVIDHTHVFHKQCLWDMYQLEQCIEDNDYLDTTIIEKNSDLYSLFFQREDMPLDKLLEISKEYKEKMNIIEKEKNNNNYQLKQNQEKEIEINENILFLQNLMNEFNELKEETLKAIDLKVVELYKETVIDKTIEIERSNRLKYIQDLVKVLGKPQQEVTPNIEKVDNSLRFS